ncbi:hypothetical protein K0M31_020253 [Melipona bicolor]|uniref:Uncharacterized protein n=1 Tax=Melipona bicolor TaxID=60889 RepID=A0AA40G265_9HYME|nr:hypothetical protein K0M31_020253 [Melipona bicolor]
MSPFDRRLMNDPSGRKRDTESRKRSSVTNGALLHDECHVCFETWMELVTEIPWSRSQGNPRESLAYCASPDRNSDLNTQRMGPRFPAVPLLPQMAESSSSG